MLSESKASPTDSEHFAAAFESCGADVRRYDPDRYFASLLAPNRHMRHGLWALYAFNLEVAKIREIVSEPMLGHIRLQWWRDSIEEVFTGSPRIHPVIQALEWLADDFDVSRQQFDTMLDAREFDLAEEVPESVAELETYARGSAGSLFALAASLPGDDAAIVPDWAEDLGTCWALTGLLRAAPHHLSLGKSYIPGWPAQKIGTNSPYDVSGEAVAEILDRVEQILSEISLTWREKTYLAALKPLLNRDIRELRSCLGKEQVPKPGNTGIRQIRMYLYHLTGR